MLAPDSFFDLSDFPDRDVFSGCSHVWDALKHIKKHIEQHTTPTCVHKCLADGVPLANPLMYYNGRLRSARECTIKYGDTTKGKLTVIENGQELSGASIIMAGAVLVGKNITIGEGVLIEAGALVKSPAIIGDQTEIRQGAYLRGNCLIGKRCVIGHATEVKHSIFLNDAKAGHFAYLGDSILGCDVNLGAGTKMANLRFLPGNIQIKTPDGPIDSELRKFGAILGDHCQTGCNSVTSPGTVMAPSCILMPNTTAPAGFHRRNTILR